MTHIQYGMLVCILLLLRECWLIPLPGVIWHEKQESDDLGSFFPYKDAHFNGATQVDPSFRDVIPQFNTTLLKQFHITSNDKRTTTTTTTENPLEKLLDKFYGSQEWRNLSEQSANKSAIPSTYIPFIERPIESGKGNLEAHQGFLGTEISGNLVSPSFMNKELTPQTPKPPLKPGSSKFMMKIVGGRQHASTDSPSGKFDSHKGQGQTQPWIFHLSKGTSAPSTFLKDQSTDEVFSVTMRPPSMSMTQRPATGIAGIGTFNPNHVNFLNGYQSPYIENIGSDTFNPDQGNNEYPLYRPNTAFNNFITQTGSDPTNQHLPVSYDPNAADERYMAESTGRVNEGFVGVAQETEYGKGQYGYRFSAYSNAQLQAFDANALNQAMIQSASNMQQRPKDLLFLPQSLDQQPTEQSYRVMTHNDKESPDIRKINTTPGLSSFQERISTTSPRPPQTFNFVPGNLFPGQSVQIAGRQFLGAVQEASPPQFLRHIPMSTGSDAFNPNAINAAQAMYNPNALSWIQTRDTERVKQQFEQKIEEDNKASTTAVSTLPVSTTANTSSDISTTVSTGTNSSTTPLSTEKAHTNGNESDTSTNTVFDPNALNANQGQSEFIPGQIAPASSGYINNPNNPDQSQDQSFKSLQNTLSPNNQGISGEGPKMSFNIAQLLGLGTWVTENNNLGGYDQNTASFNPNVVNNMMAAPFGDNTTDNTSGFDMGFAGMGFNPNAANQAFADILGAAQKSNISTGSFGGYGGFDPNTANAGFGKGGFGMGGTGASGGGSYMAAFDPNKVNQMAIQNPFEPGMNDTGNEKMFNYLLGISPGNGKGQSGVYSSAYISAFNPDSVNKASYDPNKYNQVHLHLDPLDMLINNPGMDKETLVAAASAFDPDKLNNPNMKQALSPPGILSANPGMEKNVLSGLKYDPYAGTAGSPSDHDPVSASKQNVTSSPDFDPMAVMAQLMQSADVFHPGNIGKGKQSLEPSSMFGNLQGESSQLTQSSALSPTSVPGISTVSTAMPSQSSLLLTSSVTPPFPLTTVTAAASTTSSNDAVD